MDHGATVTDARISRSTSTSATNQVLVVDQTTERQKMTQTEHANIDQHGLICDPGKFEGEPRYVQYLWNVVLDGEGETVDDPDRPDATMDLITLTDDDKRRFPALSRFDQALLWADDNGFVYCDLMRKEK